MENTQILIGHGSGGRLTHQLIRDVFRKEFGNSILDNEGDAALLVDLKGNLAFTTDSFVIDPVFFPGGDIGKLSVCGTINDLCVSGAIPKYISLGLIIEEGFPVNDLRKIAHSIAEEANKCNILVATGDTKVVKRGQCDKIFINTSGIGEVSEEHSHLSTGKLIAPGDKIIVTGTLGDHSIAILAARENLKLEENIQSDAASLIPITEIALNNPLDIHFMRDITRGGLATVLNEICSGKNFGIELYEDHIPVKKVVRSVCELYGYDPVYLANEGKIILVVKPQVVEDLIDKLKQLELAKDTAVIGSVTEDHPSKVIMNSSIGGRRILDLLNGEMLPRIC